MILDELELLEQEAQSILDRVATIRAIEKERQRFRDADRPLNLPSRLVQAALYKVFPKEKK